MWSGLDLTLVVAAGLVIPGQVQPVDPLVTHKRTQACLYIERHFIPVETVFRGAGINLHAIELSPAGERKYTERARSEAERIVIDVFYRSN